jgi:hypothetical protein
MTDRELLEKAAKAIGMPKAPRGCEIPDHLPVLFLYEGKEWNPLTDDGDALRLAVKLCIEVSPNNGVIVVNYPTGKDRLLSELHIIIEGDRYSTTRHAIVRAAAAIGEAMP